MLENNSFKQGNIIFYSVWVGWLLSKTNPSPSEYNYNGVTLSTKKLLIKPKNPGELKFHKCYLHQMLFHLNSRFCIEKIKINVNVSV